jgi:hypothetical protein
MIAARGKEIKNHGQKFLYQGVGFIVLTTSKNVADDKVTFVFTKGDASNVHSLKMSFYHRTIKANDFDVSLMKNAHGDFTALLDAHVDGAYTVFIEPVDNSWKLKEDIILPTAKTISISPEYK